VPSKGTKKFGGIVIRRSICEFSANKLLTGVEQEDHELAVLLNSRNSRDNEYAIQISHSYETLDGTLHLLLGWWVLSIAVTAKSWG
jgi:hypothetical protein